MASTFLQKPCLQFLIGFVLCVAYVPGITGAVIPTGWLVLVILAPLMLPKFDYDFGFLFLCYAALSLLWTENLNIAIFYFLKLIALSCVFQYGRSLNRLDYVFKGLCCGLGVSAVISIFQYYGYHSIYSLNNSPAGLFVNPNIFCEISVVILLTLIIFKLWWWMLITLPGLLLVQSRAGYLALGISILIGLWKKDKNLALILLFLVFGFGMIFYFNKFSMSSIQQRLDMWADTINGLRLFGNGVGSYELLYPLYATHIDTSISRPRYAHNDLLQLIFEFGVGTLLLLPLIWNVIVSRKLEKVIVYAIIVISMFTYSFNTSVMAFMGFLVAGFVVGNDPVWTMRNFRGLPIFKRFQNP